jgi:hypothetical protein
LALDEPDSSSTLFTSNGINVYMHSDLTEQLKPFGDILIDYVDYGPEQRGFMISTSAKPEGRDCAGSCGGGCGDESDR